MALCIADDCGGAAYCKDLCTRHYQRVRRFGSLDLPIRTSFEDRFWSRVEITDGCWLWTGSTTQAGYGLLSRDNRLTYAHRVAYELSVGPIPPGLTLDHLCRVRVCIRPTHLEPVSRAENTRREMAARAKEKAA